MSKSTLFKRKLIDGPHRLWPFNFEIYIILAYKVLPKDFKIFDMLGRQLSHTIQVLNLYRDPKSVDDNSVFMRARDFQDITKPYEEIYRALEEDGAFVAESKYRPKATLVNEISRLMNESSINLLWKVGYQPLVNNHVISGISKKHESKKKSDKRKVDKSAVKTNEFRHDVAKLFLIEKKRKTSLTANYFSKDDRVREKVLVIANLLGARCVENNVGRRIKEILAKDSMKNILIRNDYYSNIDIE